MKKDIVINATSTEIRVAITEDERLAEIFLEVPDKERHVGSIYLGRVERVVQGMNAAFIDIGEPQDAFLHFSDVGSALDEFKDLLDDKDDEDDDEDDETPEAKPEKPVAPKGRRNEDERREKEKDEEGADADAPVEGAPQAKRPSDRRKPDQRRGRPEPAASRTAPVAPSEEEGTARPDAPEGRPQSRDDRNRNDRNRNDRNRTDRGRDEQGRDDRGRDNRAADDRNRNDRNRNDRNRRPDNRRDQPPVEGEEQTETRERDSEALLPDQQELFPVLPDDDDTSSTETDDHAGDDRDGPRRRRKRGRRGGRGRNRKRNEQGDEQGTDSDSPNEAPEAAAPQPQREAQDRPAPERPENDRGGRHDRHGRHDNRRKPQSPNPDGPRNQEPRGADRNEPTSQRDSGPRDASPRDVDTRANEPQAERTQASRQDEKRHDRNRRDRDRRRDNRNRDDRNRDDRNRDESAPAPASAPPASEATEPAPERRREPQGRAPQQPRPAATPAPESPVRTAAEPEPAQAKKEPARKNPRAPRRERPQRGAGADEGTTSTPSADERADAGRTGKARPNTEATAPEATEKPTEKKTRAAKTPRTPRGGGGRKRGGDDDAPVKGNTVDAKLPTFQTKRSGEVTIGLEKGKDVIVQVTRESYASKGVRVTTKVSLPGRFLVLLPLDPAIGISRKVQNMKERRRLRRIAKSILPEGHGCIIRTVAQDKDEEVIRQDLTKLIDAWRDIEHKIKQTDKPGLLYKDQSIANTVMRDLFTLDTNRVVIDNKALYKEIRDYVEWAAPSLVKKVELYSGPRPIFDQFGIEKELQKVAERKVYIPSGGYIILDQTEAMMVIDVNSGRYAGKKDQELNSLRTNLESAREIARQIRLRDIGGLIVVDFIDLYDEKNRKKVYDEMKKEMKKDRAKSVVLPMTQFGLVQMTRQRIRQQVVQTISEPCPVCSGSGLVQSKSTVIRNIERWLQRFRENSREFRLTLTANPIIIDYLTEGEMSRLTKMMLKYFVRIKVIPDDSLGVDEFQFYSVRTGTDVTANFPEDTSNGIRKREKEKEKEKEKDPKDKDKDKGDREKGKGQGRAPSRKPRETAGNAPAPVVAAANGAPSGTANGQ